MAETHFVWPDIERDELPNLLFQRKKSLIRRIGNDWRAPTDRHGFALGCSAVPSGELIPQMFVVDEKASADVFSWLNSFYPDAFPLSQYVRVVDARDWITVEANDVNRPLSSLWSSIMVGELLTLRTPAAHGKIPPTSWLANTHTHAVAHAISHRKSLEMLDELTDRLAYLESDPRIIPRSINVRDLAPIWLATAALSEINECVDVMHAPIVALRAAEKVGPPPHVDLAEMVMSRPDFQSVSLESRVVAFNAFRQDLLRQGDDKKNLGGRIAQSACLAAAAFLVGRGTSHAQLLARSVEDFPHVYLWMSLMAGIAGSDAHDADWSRLRMRAERYLSDSREISRHTPCDLSWLEYRWHRNASRSPIAFEEAPKLTANSLLIEVYPGSVCQLRLRSEQSEAKNNAYDADLRSRRALQDIERIIATADSVRRTLLGSESTRARNEVVHEQKSFLSDSDQDQARRVTKGRRNKS